MFTIDNLNKIAIIEGDSGHFRINVKEYVLTEGDTVYFSVSSEKTLEKGGRYLFQKVITEFEEDGGCFISIEPEDTKGKVGSYFYDVQITLANGYVDTVIGPTIFTIKGGITHE